MGAPETRVRARRLACGVHPVYKRVDTCAAEFATSTAYLYSTYEQECESDPTPRPKIMILGGGPNRIGQGIEFDYCCVHAALALREDGYETIMVNCNPETVSTDYDISDRLYFEPLTFEDVMEVINREKPQGVIVQFGGQTPLKLARQLAAAGAPIIGTSPDSIDVAEDRERFQQLLMQLGLRQPANATARDEERAIELAREVGFPLIVRPSYVLGGRAMEIVYDEEDLRAYMREAVKVSNDSPVLLDRFLDLAIEVDVDAVCDGKDVLIGGIMEHVEQAGVHSGDSSCSLPPASLSHEIQDEIRGADAQDGAGAVRRRPHERPVRDPERRRLRARGESARLAHGAVRVQGDRPAAGQDRGAGHGRPQASRPRRHRRARAAVLLGQGSGVPVRQVPRLRPDPRARDEVDRRGHGHRAHVRRGLREGAGGERRAPADARGLPDFACATATRRPRSTLARRLVERGFEIIATQGTQSALEAAGVPCRRALKVREGRPHIVDMIKNDEIDLIINTTEGKRAIRESHSIRREAELRKVTYYTTVAAAHATLDALDHLEDHDVNRLQDLHRELGAA